MISEERNNDSDLHKTLSDTTYDNTKIVYQSGFWQKETGKSIDKDNIILISRTSPKETSPSI